MTRTTRTPKPAYIPRIVRMTIDGLYQVQSESNPAVYYTSDPILETCSCPAGQWGHASCKHRRLALQVWTAHRRLRLAARQRSMEAAGAFPVAA